MMNTKGRLRTFFSAAIAVAGIFLATTASAQEAVLELDPAQTQVAFTLGDVLHTVHGTFKLKSGTIHFDPATGHASGQVVVDATSGDSGSHGRDRKMHKEVLESAQYPEATFTPEQIQGQFSPHGDFQVQVQGIFKLHGADHTLTLVFQVHVDGDQLTASTNFSIPYVNWGLKNPSTFILRVDETVQIDIHTTGRIKLSPSHGLG
jgi:polyisoprenoid-binding protein YceI